MAISKNFKTIPLSPPAWATGGLSPLAGRQDLNVKKITFRSWRPGRIKQRICKIDIKSQKNWKNITSTVLDSTKQYIQLLLHNVFHLINVSCSILNTSLMHFYLNLKIHSLARVLHMVSIGLYKIGRPSKHFQNKFLN